MGALTIRGILTPTGYILSAALCVKYLLALSLPSELQPRITSESRHVIVTGGTPGRKNHTATLDFCWQCVIIAIEKGAADRRLAPPMVKRSNRRVVSWGGYFFLSFSRRTREISATRNIQNCKSSGHVTSMSSTPFLSIGGKKCYPRNRGTNRLLAVRRAANQNFRLPVAIAP